MIVDPENTSVELVSAPFFQFFCVEGLLRFFFTETGFLHTNLSAFLTSETGVDLDHYSFVP